MILMRLRNTIASLLLVSFPFTSVAECSKCYDGISCCHEAYWDIGMAIGAGLLGGAAGMAFTKSKKGREGSSGTSGAIGPTGAVGPAGPPGAPFTVPEGPAELTFTFVNGIGGASLPILPPGSFIPLVVQPDQTVITGLPAIPGGSPVVIEIPAPAQIGTYQIVLHLAATTPFFVEATVTVVNNLNPTEIAMYSTGFDSNDNVGQQETFEFTYSPTIIP